MGNMTPIAGIPAIVLREPSAEDFTHLGMIQAGYVTDTILTLRTIHALDEMAEPTDSTPTNSTVPLRFGWELAEAQYHFDKGALYDLSHASLIDPIRERATRPDDVMQRVADYEGRLVGFVDIELHDDGATLWNLHIDRNYRQQGLGRRLWLRAREYVKANGLDLIWIETQNTNIPAIRFYQALGCTVRGFHADAYGRDSRGKQGDTAQAEMREFAIYLTYHLGR